MMSIQDPDSLFRIVEARVDIARVKVSRARGGRQRERERAGRESREINICTGAVTAQLPMKIEGKRCHRPIRWKMTLKPKRFFPFSLSCHGNGNKAKSTWSAGCLPAIDFHGSQQNMVATAASTFLTLPDCQRSSEEQLGGWQNPGQPSPIFHFTARYQVAKKGAVEFRIEPGRQRAIFDPSHRHNWPVGRR